MTLTKTFAKTDHEIQLDVIAEIERDWRFRPAEVGIEVDDGIVTLTGTVSSFLKVGEAAEIAARVSGVKGVANKLTVTLPGLYVQDDTKIAQAVRNALLWDTVVPEERIESIVRNGVVTLKGTVDYWYQWKSAVDVVKRISGVMGVNDHVGIAPPLRNDAHLHDEIKAALGRRLPLEKFDVTVNDGYVTVMGSVPSYRIRREAEDIAWWTTGVKGVTNRIEVAY
jgi:osmotically-inducible protein OsmY